MSAPPARPRGSVAGALAVVYVTWGSTFVAMRVAVRSLPPLTMTGVRFLAAGFLLYGWCWWQRHRHPEAGWRSLTRREWRASAILGIALPAAGTGGATWAEQKIPAGTAALLLASIPVWMIIASRVADRERITVLTAAGMILGVAGVGTLLNPFAGGAPNPLASAVALGGALSWGCGSVYAKRAAHPGQPLAASGAEMICAGLALCVAGAASGELGRIGAASLFSASGLALGYLIVFGSLLGYSTYEWLLHHASSQLAGTYAFVSPLVAVILGWWLLGERISGLTLVAAGAISIGVALIMLHPRRTGDRAGRSASQAQELPAERLPVRHRLFGSRASDRNFFLSTGPRRRSPRSRQLYPDHTETLRTRDSLSHSTRKPPLPMALTAAQFRSQLVTE